MHKEALEESSKASHGLSGSAFIVSDCSGIVSLSSGLTLLPCQDFFFGT